MSMWWAAGGDRESRRRCDGATLKDAVLVEDAGAGHGLERRCSHRVVISACIYYCRVLLLLIFFESGLLDILVVLS